MQRVSVTRLLKDRTSHESFLIMAALESGEELRIGVPEHKAGVLALEAHGLNDRCPLYCILLECVAQLGGSFGPVVITRNEVYGDGAAISLTQDSQARWVSADLVELVALALHLQLPIFVNTVVPLKGTECRDEQDNSGIPSVFHETFRKNMLADGDEDRTSP